MRYLTFQTSYVLLLKDLTFFFAGVKDRSVEVQGSFKPKLLTKENKKWLSQI